MTDLDLTKFKEVAKKQSYWSLSSDGTISGLVNNEYVETGVGFEDLIMEVAQVHIDLKSKDFKTFLNDINDIISKIHNLILRLEI
jgi:hypothetical protein